MRRLVAYFGGEASNSKYQDERVRFDKKAAQGVDITHDGGPREELIVRSHRERNCAGNQLVGPDGSRQGRKTP